MSLSTFAAALSDWMDFDGAEFELAKALGLMPDIPWDPATTKTAFWTSNPLGDTVAKILQDLVALGALETCDDGLVFRWKPGFVWTQAMARPPTTTGPHRVDLTDRVNFQGPARRTLVHLRGYYGDGGENEGVLSVGAQLDEGPLYPECGRIIVGSPRESPLMDGYRPKLGGFSCSPDAADRFADELKAQAANARAAMKRPAFQPPGKGDVKP